ncbi:MAG: hypothetical protein JXP34_00865 [Planctomycetes bacterium]|nr:hypothetical protein [Planctomycetota bacterium]
MDTRHDEYIEGYRKRREAERSARERQRTEILAGIRALSPCFAGLPGLERVHVFGSAAASGRFRSTSGVDIAFERLTAEIFCGTFGEVARRIDRDIDATPSRPCSARRAA